MSTQPREIQVVLNEATPDHDHGWLLTTKQVAEGYDVDPSTIRGHKKNKPNELLENQHWITEGKSTLWTKAGVIQLGMHITSDRAADFRRMAEQIILTAMDSNQAQSITAAASDNVRKVLPQAAEEDTGSDIIPGLDALDELAKTLAGSIAPALATKYIRKRIADHLPHQIERSLETVGKSVVIAVKKDYGVDLSQEIGEAIAIYRESMPAQTTVA